MVLSISEPALNRERKSRICLYYMMNLCIVLFYVLAFWNCFKTNFPLTFFWDLILINSDAPYVTLERRKYVIGFHCQKYEERTDSRYANLEKNIFSAF